MDSSKRLFRKNITIFIISTLVFLTNLSSFSKEDDDWLIRKSFHFVVYYKDCSQNFLDRLINRAEDCYKDIALELGLTRDEPWVWEKRAKIYVFENKDEYVSNTGMPNWSLGCARPFQRTVYTYSESYEFLKYTITHELTHLIFREFIGNVDIPLWFDEGFAVYMERKNETSSLVRVVRNLLRKNELIPFDELLTARFTDLDKQRGPESQLTGLDYVGKFYIQSFSLCYFLIKKHSQFRFKSLLRKLRDGSNFSEAFPQAYMVFRNKENFKKEWQEFYK